MSTQEKIQSLVHQMDETKAREVLDFVMFLCVRHRDEADDILKASESSLAFWDTPEDEIWDNV
jgi:hypothetical protein